MSAKEQEKPKLPSVTELMEIMTAMANFFKIQGNSIIQISEFQEKYEKQLREFQGLDPNEIINQVKKDDSKIADKFVLFYLEYAKLLSLQANANTPEAKKGIGKKLVRLGDILTEIEKEINNELNKGKR